MQNNDPNSWMLKHIKNEHGGKKEEVKFSWKVIQKHPKPLPRQLQEAVRLKNRPDEQNLNSKSEYLGRRIKRIVLDKKIHDLHCKT